jgi:hypothetical protein
MVMPLAEFVNADKNLPGVLFHPHAGISKPLMNTCNEDGIYLKLDPVSRFRNGLECLLANELRGCAKITSHAAAGSQACRICVNQHSILQA